MAAGGVTPSPSLVPPDDATHRWTFSRPEERTMPSGSDSLGATRHPLSPLPRCKSALKTGQPTAAPKRDQNRPARRPGKHGDYAAAMPPLTGRPPQTGRTESKPLARRSEEEDSSTQYPPPGGRFSSADAWPVLKRRMTVGRGVYRLKSPAVPSALGDDPRRAELASCRFWTHRPRTSSSALTCDANFSEWLIRNCSRFQSRHRIAGRSLACGHATSDQSGSARASPMRNAR